MAERLWVCHRCKMIGTGFQAGRHVDATVHPVEQLSREASDAVRAERRRNASLWPFLGPATDFIAFAAFRKTGSDLR